MEDIGIKDTIRFSVRCAALFINKDKILIHRKRGDRFYTLPGGKCKLGEDSRHAVEREISEELNFNATMKRMVFIGENFFRSQHTKRHEILFVYLASERSTRQLIKLIPDKIRTGNLNFEWMSMNRLKDVRLNPLSISEMIKRGMQKSFVTLHHVSNYIP